MAKHRSLNNKTTRRVATVAAVVMGTTVLAPGIASAVEVNIPNTGSSVNVPGLENIPHAEKYINSLPGQGNSYAAPVTAPAAIAAPRAAVQAPSTGQAIVNAVRSKVGAPYGWGAAGPSAFDCSGLTSWAYQQAGKTIPRTSQAQANQGQSVSLNALQPGDIIAYYGGASHVGIYVGNGMIIDALNSNSPVAERPLHWMPVHSAVRF